MEVRERERSSRGKERNRPRGAVHFTVLDSKASFYQAGHKSNRGEIWGGGERDFVERSSGEKLLDTLLATCTICSAATLDLSILYHPVFLATERSDEWKIKLSQHARCPGWVDSTRGKGTWVGATRFVKLINGGGRRGIGDEKQNRRWWELFFVRFLPIFHENKNVSPTLFKFSSQMNYFVEYTNCHWKKPWSANKGSTS